MEKMPNEKEIAEVKPSKNNYPKELKDRIVIYGVHPKDPNHVIYSFWASNFLITQFPCVGDFVNVNTKKHRTQLYITDIQKWQDGMYEPTQIARALYTGQLYEDFSYEID